MKKPISVFSVIKLVLLVLVLVSITIYLHNSLKEIADYHFSIDYSYLVISLVILLFAQCALPVIWFFITVSLQCNLSFYESIRIRLISGIGKYIPGRVFGYGYLLIHYKEKGMSPKSVLASSFYELLLAAFSAFLFFSITLMFTNYRLLDDYKFVFYLLSVAGVILLHPSISQKPVNYILRLLKKDEINQRINYSRILQYTFYYFLVWMTYGIAFYYFVNAFTPQNIDLLIYLAGTFAVSTFAGFMAFFLPAGIGAREGMLVFLLNSITGNAIALIIAVGSRIWMIFVDVVLFCIALLTKPSKKIADNS